MSKTSDESKEMKTKIEKERSRFKELMAKNPNYFGTSPQTRLKAVSEIKDNTKYEEIGCIGFYPELDLLEAVINVKLPYGYKGNLCTAGTFEYVRFFVDWDGDGDFEDPEEDVGIVSVNVHDIPDQGAFCIERTKPLSYGLALKIDTKKKPCKIPHLVKVRAILSWEAPPTAGNPDFPVVWGNVVEQWIQIKSCEYKVKDIVGCVDLTKLDLDPTMLDLDVQVSKPQKPTSSELKEIYKQEDVPQHRYDFSNISQVVEQVKKTPSAMAEYAADPEFKKIQTAVNAVLSMTSNTIYEELNCVGLNYDCDQLMATMTIKRPYGYSGDLCADGSYEYVAFWVYVHDEIEQTCVWRHLGTTRVNVHDIETLPHAGLKYAVYLPADLSILRDKCQKPKIVRIRAVLSWNLEPDPNNPFQNPVWGNSKEALIQIKPGQAVLPGERRPSIWAVSTMPVESISGNANTVLPSVLGDGYANGISINHGFTAVESPFGRNIAISGKITNAPDNPDPADKLKYKVQYKKSGAGWNDIKDAFKIWLRIDGLPGDEDGQDQIADGDGYFRYESDDALGTTSPKVEVQDDMLAIWHTPVAEGNGLYSLRVLLWVPGAPPQPGVPANHVASHEVKVMIDNKEPDLEPYAAISLDMGACQQFTVGDDFTGKFTATDPHIWRYSIDVLPESVVGRPTVSPSYSQYPILSAPGKTDETFTLTTTGDTPPCGYVLRIRVRDRAIVNSRFPGNRATADAGFCLLENE